MEGGDGPTAQEEADLVARAAAGDAVAHRLLFERYAETLRGFALRWLPADLRRTVGASDVIQETHLVAIRRLGEFQDRGEGSLRNWLLQILRYKVREAIRRHNRRRLREAPPSALGSSPSGPGGGPTPSQAAAATELGEVARRALEALPEDQRELLRMVRRDGMGLRMVAECLGRNYEAVKKAYARALARFTREFERLREDLGG